MRKIILFLTLFMILNLFSLTNLWSHSATVVHPKLSDKAVSNLDAFFNEVKTYKNQIKQGSIDEDTPIWQVLNHFYNPINGAGFPGGMPTNQYVKDIWDASIYEYSQGNKTEAYYLLGKVAHLVQDMSVPAHVHIDSHLFGDDYEIWCKGPGETGSNIIGCVNTAEGYITVSGYEDAIEQMARLGYDSSRFEATLYADSRSVDENCELAKMFPGSIRYIVPLDANTLDNGFWEIDNIGNYDGVETDNGSNDWWEIDEYIGWFYIENIGGDSYPVAPEQIRSDITNPSTNSSMVSNTKSLYQLFAEQLIPLPIKYSTGLLKYFYDNRPQIVYPSKVTNLTATSTVDSVSLIWEAATEGAAVKNYAIYRDNSYVGQTNSTTLTFTDMGRSANTIYEYEVSAIAENGLEGEKTGIMVVTQSQPGSNEPVPVIMNQISNITETTAVLSWSQSNDGNFKEYRIYRSQGSGVSENSTLVTTITSRAITAFTDIGLSEATTYYYRVYVFNTQDLSAKSNEVFARSIGNTIPDFAVSPEDISMQSTNPNPGDIVTINAIIHNIGQIPPDDEIVVRFYDGDPANGGILIGEDKKSFCWVFGGDASDTYGVDCGIIVDDNLEKRLYLSDTSFQLFGPNNIDLEGSNSAGGKYYTDNCLTVDFNNGAWQNVNITPTPHIVKAYDSGFIHVRVSVSGDFDSGGHFKANFHIRGRKARDNNQPIEASVNWNTSNRTGSHDIYVVVDPDNIITSEVNKGNNISHKRINIGPDKPDLNITSNDISFTRETLDVTIKAKISNTNNIEANNVKVNFYDGLPSNNILIGSTTIPKIPIPLLSGSKSGDDWATMETGIFQLVITSSTVDNGGLAPGTYTALKKNWIYSNISYGDNLPINVNPEVTASHHNNTLEIYEKTATGFKTRIWTYADIYQPGVAFSYRPWLYTKDQITFDWSLPEYNSVAQVSWNINGLSGSHDVYVVVDPDDSISEVQEDNNTASKSITFENQPPNIPVAPSGPISGYTTEIYSFSTYSSDINGDKIKFVFDWGDGTTTETDYGDYDYTGKVIMSASHTWSSEGIYDVKVQAIDTSNSSTDFSEPLKATLIQKSGWGSDNPITPGTRIDRFPEVDSDNSGNVHIAWFGKGSTGNIYYRRLINNGNTWNDESDFGTVTLNDTHLPIIRSDKTSSLQLLWDDYRATGNFEIYRKTSSDQGFSWTYPDENFSYTTANSRFPSIAINGQTIHAVWAEGNKIHYKKSSNGGTTWSNPSTIITTPFFNVNSRLNLVCDSTSNVFLVWAGQMPNVAWAIKNAYFSYSKDNGNTWQSTQTIYSDTSFAGFELNPDITVDSSSNIYIVYDTKSNQIFYRTGAWSGGNMVLSSPAVLVSDIHNSQYPNIRADRSNNLYLFWQNARDGNYEIYNKFRKAGETTWGADTRLTQAAGDSLYPKASITGGYLHLVWQDNRNGNYQIYYNRMRLRRAPWVIDFSAPHFDVPPYDESVPPYENNDPNQTAISFKVQDDTYNKHTVSVWVYNVNGTSVIKKLITDQIINLDSNSDLNWPYMKTFTDFVIWDGRDENGNFVSESTSYKVKISVRAVDDPTIEPIDGLPGLIGTNWTNIDTTDQEYIFTDPTFVQPNRKNIKAWHEFIRQ
ncbi:MAG: zinc dependent phospholipase C family protein [bacterium]|nr:zinc dependent phospholipase C family protein [bacterium]